MNEIVVGTFRTNTRDLAVVVRQREVERLNLALSLACEALWAESVRLGRMDERVGAKHTNAMSVVDELRRTIAEGGRC